MLMDLARALLLGAIVSMIVLFFFGSPSNGATWEGAYPDQSNRIHYYAATMSESTYVGIFRTSDANVLIAQPREQQLTSVQDGDYVKYILEVDGVGIAAGHAQVGRRDVSFADGHIYSTVVNQAVIEHLRTGYEATLHLITTPGLTAVQLKFSLENSGEALRPCVGVIN